MKERKYFRVGLVYRSGKNPPREGRVPEGFEWTCITDKYGNPAGGFRLVPKGQLEEGPPLFTPEEREQTSSLPSLGPPFLHAQHVAEAQERKED